MLYDYTVIGTRPRSRGTRAVGNRHAFSATRLRSRATSPFQRPVKRTLDLPLFHRRSLPATASERCYHNNALAIGAQLGACVSSVMSPCDTWVALLVCPTVSVRLAMFPVVSWISMRYALDEPELTKETLVWRKNQPNGIWSARCSTSSAEHSAWRQQS